MAFLLKLKDPDDEINFLDNVNYILKDGGFDMGRAEKEEVWGGNPDYTGGLSLVNVAYKNRQISITFEVKGSTRDLVLASLNDIENMLTRVVDASLQSDLLYVCELQYQWDSASNINYFNILSGELKWPRDVMSVEQIHQKDESGNWIIQNMVLDLVADPFIDKISPLSGSPVALGLHNNNDTKTTNYVLVKSYNPSPYGKNVYVDIDGEDIDGDAPADFRLSFYGDSSTTSKLFRLSVGVLTDADSLIFSLSEAEGQSTCLSGDPFLLRQSNSNASGGYYVPVSVTTGHLNTDVTLITHGEAYMVATGRPGIYRMEYSFFPSGIGITGEMWLEFPGHNTRTRKIEINSGTVNFGYADLSVPVNPDRGRGTDGVNVQLKAHPLTTGSVYLDCLRTIPVTDGNRIYEVGTTFFGDSGFGYDTIYAVNDIIIDDGMKDTIYTAMDDDSGQARLDVVAFGPPIKLLPRKDHRLYFYFETYDSGGYYTFPYLRSFVKASYVPKYKSGVV